MGSADWDVNYQKMYSRSFSIRAAGLPAKLINSSFFASIKESRINHDTVYVYDTVVVVVVEALQRTLPKAYLRAG